MKRIVFGLGLLQVVVSMALITALLMLFGVNWQLGIALGGVFAMSSTAVLTKLLAERMQFDTAHGREIIGVLLLQDLAPARQGDQLAGASIGQIEAALRQAARLHAPFWGDARLNDIAWLQPSPAAATMIRQMTAPFYAQFRDRYAYSGSPPRSSRWATPSFSRVQSYFELIPDAPTVQHRDFRIDNILFSTDGGRAYVVDWQTLGVGAGARSA